jgi:hypothetical protein
LRLSAKRVEGRVQRSRNHGNKNTALGLSTQGLRYNVLCQLAETRILEGNALLKLEYYTGAAYISGYAVELYLKAYLSFQHNAGFWPLNVPEKYKTHNLENLLGECGLRATMRTASIHNPELGINWNIITTQWETELRYRNLKKNLAVDICEAVAARKDGVAQWLRLKLEIAGA